MNVDNCMMTWADEGMAMSENYPSEVLLYSSVLLLHCLWLQDAGRASWSGQAGLQMLTHAFGIFFHQSQGYHLQSSKGWCVVWRWKTKPTGGSSVLINNLRHCVLESIIWFFFFMKICEYPCPRWTVTTRWQEPDAAENISRNAEGSVLCWAAAMQSVKGLPPPQQIAGHQHSTSFWMSSE